MSDRAVDQPEARPDRPWSGDQPYVSQPYGDQQHGHDSWQQYGADPYASQPFGDQSSTGGQYGAQPYAPPQYGSQPYGPPQYGSQQYGAQQYGPYSGLPYAGQPNAVNPYQSPYAVPYVGPPLTHPQATIALILGIVGVVMFPIVGIVGLVIGLKARREIDAKPGLYSGRGMATAGFALGIVSIFIGILWIFFMASVLGRLS